MAQVTGGFQEGRGGGGIGRAGPGRDRDQQKRVKDLWTRLQKSVTWLMTAPMCSFSAQMNTNPTGHSLGRGRAARRGPGSVSDQLHCIPLQPETAAGTYKETRGGNSLCTVGIESKCYQTCIQAWGRLSVPASSSFTTFHAASVMYRWAK